MKQLLKLIDKIDIDEIGAREKIQREVMRYRKFSYGVLGQETEFDKRPIEADIRNYAKYLLSEGSKEEKRELLGCLKSRIEIKARSICLRVGVDRN